jgi:hypothetical protein
LTLVRTDNPVALRPPVETFVEVTLAMELWPVTFIAPVVKVVATKFVVVKESTLTVPDV